MSNFDFYLKNGLVVAGNATVGGSILMDSIRTSVASNVAVSSSTTVIDSFPANVVRSARYHMQVVTPGAYQTSWILLVHDGSNSYLTEYAIVSSMGFSIVNFSTDISDGNVRLMGQGILGSSSIWYQKTSIETAADD